MDQVFRLQLGEYEYTYEDGKQTITRNNLPWRDETGDNLILAMAMRIKDLEKDVKVLEKYVDKLEDTVDYLEMREGHY